VAATTFTGTGSWSDGTKWSLGVQPTAAEDVTITQDADCTLDAITCVAKSVTIASRTSGTTGGKLRPSTTAHSKLVVEQGINSTGSATAAYSSHFLFDMSAAASYNCEIVLNNVRQTTDSTITTQATTHGLWLNGNFTLKGAAKKRHTTLSSALSVGASSCSVPDVTGWIAGDAVIFAMTDGAGATSAPHTDIVEISSITGAGPYTVNFSATPDTTKNPGAVATCAYAHASGSPVGNLSGNLIIRPGTAGDKTYVHCRADTANQNADSYVTDVEFRSMAVPAVFVFGCLSSYGASAYLKSVSNNSFYNFTTTSSYTALSIYTGGSPGIKAAFTRQNNIFYAATGVSSNPTIYTVGAVSPIGPDEDYVIFSGGTGVTVAMPGQHQVNPKISGLRRGTAYSADAAIVVNISGITITNPQIWSCYGAAIGGTQPCTIEDGSIGSGTFSGCNNAAGIVAYAGTTVATDFTTQSANTVKDMNPAYSKSGFVQFVNKDDDLAVQQIYSYHSNTDPVIQKDVSIYNRSTSSICMTCNHADAITTSFSVLAKAGETIKVIGWVRKSSSPAYGASTLPSITISGLGITQVVATMAGGTAADDWEELTLTATNPSSTNDGNFTITLTAQSGTAGAKAYFSGIPNSPFVTRCRHYGHLFQETSPTREVDDLSSANFATADGYTGFSITWGASTSPITLSASHTFQELFDYHQAKACQNGDKVLAITGAGVAGSPALFTENDSNVTINTGYTLSGSGSLTIGGTSTLTTEFAGGSAYTYTDGTWSQTTDVPTFNGGQLNIGAAGTYTYVQAAGMILSMTPTAPGTYALGATTFTGQVDLRNTSVTHAITAELPSGTSYTTANNTGAAITVSTPQLYQSVTITGADSGSRIQVYDTTSSTQLYEGTPAFPYTWTDGTAAAANRAIRLRVSKQSTVTARDFLEANIGTCGTTSGTKDISYLVTQSNDDTYNTNAIDGGTVTGITIDDTLDRVKISIAGGAVTWQSIYAYNVYWLNTSAGIIDDGAFVSAPDVANYLFTGFDIRNDSATPLVISGGWGRDAATGLSKDIIDHAGSAGNIYLTSDHVVPYSTGSGLTAGQAAQLTAIEGYTDTIPADILAATVEGSTTVKHSLMRSNAVLSGKVSGAGTGTETFRDIADTKDRIVVSTDVDGNRTMVVMDAS